MNSVIRTHDFAVCEKPEILQYDRRICYFSTPLVLGPKLQDQFRLASVRSGLITPMISCSICGVH